MDLIIRHNREAQNGYYMKDKWDRSTVVLEKPHSAEIMQEMRRQYTKSCGFKIPKITINIGGSSVYHKDCYNKKLGRKMATGRIKPVEFKIAQSGYVNHDEAIHLNLTGNDAELKVQYSIELKIYRDSGDIRIMSVHTRFWA